MGYTLAEYLHNNMMSKGECFIGIVRQVMYRQTNIQARSQQICEHSYHMGNHRFSQHVELRWKQHHYERWDVWMEHILIMDTTVFF